MMAAGVEGMLAIQPVTDKMKIPVCFCGWNCQVPAC